MGCAVGALFLFTGLLRFTRNDNVSRKLVFFVIASKRSDARQSSLSYVARSAQNFSSQRRRMYFYFSPIFSCIWHSVGVSTSNAAARRIRPDSAKIPSTVPITSSPLAIAIPPAKLRLVADVADRNKSPIPHKSKNDSIFAPMAMPICATSPQARVNIIARSFSPAAATEL